MSGKAHRDMIAHRIDNGLHISDADVAALVAYYDKSTAEAAALRVERDIAYDQRDKVLHESADIVNRWETEALAELKAEAAALRQSSAELVADAYGLKQEAEREAAALRAFVRKALDSTDWNEFDDGRADIEREGRALLAWDAGAGKEKA